MDYRNHVNYPITVLIFAFTISFTMVLAEPQSYPRTTENFQEGCKNNNTNPFEIIGYKGIPILICKTFDWKGGINIWANDGYNYILRGSDYFVVEQLTKSCDNGDPDCKTMLGDKEILVSQPKKIEPIPTSDGSHPIILIKDQNETKPEVKIQIENLGISAPQPKLLLCTSSSPITKVYSSVKYEGIINACQFDEDNDLWNGTDTHIYKREFFYEESFTKKQIEKWSDVTPIKNKCNDGIKTVMERTNCNYKELVDYSRNNAMQIFNSTKLVKQIKPFIAPSVGKGLLDCSGSKVTQKQLDCNISQTLKIEQQKAVTKWNATETIATLKPSTTITSEKEHHRTLFLQQQAKLGNWLLK